MNIANCDMPVLLSSRTFNYKKFHKKPFCKGHEHVTGKYKFLVSQDTKSEMLF